MNVILLAAGVGKRFGQKTKSLPKCLIPLKPGETLLKRYLEAFRKTGLKQIFIVVGHQKEKINSACRKHGRRLDIRFLSNRSYRKGSVLSLHTASKHIGNSIIMDADVFFSLSQLKRLIHSRHPTAFLLDPRSRFTGEEMMVTAKGKRLWSISKTPDPRLKAVGEATGFFKVSKKDGSLLKKILTDFVRNKRTFVEYEEAYNVLMKRRNVGFEAIKGFWKEMDFMEDFEKIRTRLA